MYFNERRYLMKNIQLTRFVKSIIHSNTSCTKSDVRQRKLTLAICVLQLSRALELMLVRCLRT